MADPGRRGDAFRCRDHAWQLTTPRAGACAAPSSCGSWHPLIRHLPGRRATLRLSGIPTPRRRRCRRSRLQRQLVPEHLLNAQRRRRRRSPFQQRPQQSTHRATGTARRHYVSRVSLVAPRLLSCVAGRTDFPLSKKSFFPEKVVESAWSGRLHIDTRNVTHYGLS